MHKINKRSSIYYILIGFLVGLLCGSIGSGFVNSFVHRQDVFSIGIYMGDSPFNFYSPKNIKNPILTAKDITDRPAIFVADPFMVKENSGWYMFFEVLIKNGHGDIGVAISNDAITWNYKQIVLDEPFHLSFPYVFRWNNDYYMIPESNQMNSIRLYRANNFPFQWDYIGDLLKGRGFRDSSILRYHGKWWLFTTTSAKHDNLRLYYSNDLKGTWKEHSKSPIVVGNPHISRSGGRVIEYNGHIIRYAQDDYPTYGNQLWAYRITELTTTTYKEEKVSINPILKASGFGWNRLGMHQIDPHQVGKNKWIACVDGKKRGLFLRLPIINLIKDRKHYEKI